MRQILLKIIGIFSLVILFSIGAQAQTATPGVTGRQINQHERIKDGVQDGEITRRERRRLARQQRDIRRTKREAKADGVVTGEERAEIHRKQNRANRNIRRKKNNEIDRD